MINTMCNIIDKAILREMVNDIILAKYEKILENYSISMFV